MFIMVVFELIRHVVSRPIILFDLYSRLNSNDSTILSTLILCFSSPLISNYLFSISQQLPLLNISTAFQAISLPYPP